MKNKKLVIYVLIFVLVMGAAYVLYTNLSSNMAPGQLATAPQENPDSTAGGSAPQSTEPPKTAAPDFTVYDLQGNPVKFSDFIGKPIILNFWSSNCGPCRTEMPDFQKFYEIYGDRIQFLMVNVTDNSWDTITSASKFVADNGFTFPVFYDTDVDAATVYGIRSLPSTYFIDRDGNLYAYARGMIREDTLQKGVDELLKS